MTIIDLRNKKIPENHSVTVMRPGAKYKLYTEFYENNRVGPDLPGFFMEGEEFSSEPQFFTQRIKRARSIKNWLPVKNRLSLESPSFELDAYDGETDQSVRQFARISKYYLTEAKIGDLVVMPSPKFDGLVYIGEYTSSVIRKMYSQHYQGYPLWTREVRWLGQFPKTSLSGKTIDALRTPTALLLLGRSERGLIYRNAYRNFSTGNGYSAVFDVGSPDFNTFHGSVIPAFFNFVAANMREVELGGEGLEFSESAFISLGDYSPELALSVQSPGTLTLASQYITPLVAGALLVIAIQLGASAASPDIIENIQIVNNGEGDDQCALPVEESVKAYLRLLGYDKWSDACEKIVTAAQQTDLKSETVLRDVEK